MDLAFSPCPNDTYLFWAWVHGHTGPIVRPHLADIQTLNEWALQKRYPLSKVSVATAARLLEDYAICPAGAALGYGCGPKLIAKVPFALEDLPSKQVAIPGQDTTAHLLLKRLCPRPKKKRFCLYHEAPSLLANGQVDAALIIHEHRFVFPDLGFVEIADLGALWEARYQVPVPLGCLVVCRHLPDMTSTVQASLDYAHYHPDEVLPYILAHSQHLSSDVVRQHIATYVTSESHHLSPQGIQAISLLLDQPSEAWLWTT